MLYYEPTEKGGKNMKKRNKQLLFFLTAFTLATSSIPLKLCKEKSSKYTNEILSHICSKNNDDILIASHRGFSSLEVENTEPAIRLAASKPYIDYIEIDARLTADKKIVLSHNDKLKINNIYDLNISTTDYKTLTDATFIYETSPLLEDIKTIFNITNGELLRTREHKLNRTTYKISSLKEGLQACGDKKVFLDLKFNKNTKDFINALTAELQDIDKSNIIFQSSDLISLLYLQNLYPDYNCLAILRKEEELDYVPLFQNLGIRKNLIDEDIVKDAVTAGKNVSIWTLNQPEEIEQVHKELGNYSQDVIYITDYPDMVDGYIHKNKKR